MHLRERIGISLLCGGRGPRRACGHSDLRGDEQAGSGRRALAGVLVLLLVAASGVWAVPGDRSQPPPGIARPSPGNLPLGPALDGHGWQELPLVRAASVVTIAPPLSSPTGLPRGARFVRDPRTGLPRLLYDFDDPPRGADPIAAARSFLQQYRSVLLGDGAPADLELVELIRRPGASHVRFEQRHGGLPVWGAGLSVHVDEAGRVRMVSGAFFPGVRVTAPVRLTPAEAARRAVAEAGAQERLVGEPSVAPGLYPRLRIYRPAYRVRFATVAPADWECFVDAATGAILECENRGREADGTGLVVEENPWVTPALVERPFPYLAGDGYLRGQFADVWVFDRYVDNSFLRKRNAFSEQHAFTAGSDSPQFEEQMLYYHVTRARDWFREKFGFTGRDHPLAVHAHWPALGPNGEPVPYNNAYYSPFRQSLFFGSGTGVAGGGLNSLARDADVIYHEYGHAVVDRITNLGRWQDDWGTALNEAFADYFACAINGNPAMGEYSIGRGAGLRNLTSPNRFPSHVNHPARGLPESHYTGIIWGSACWDLRRRLGPEVADRVLFESLYFLPPDGSATFPVALAAVLEADGALHGGRHKEAIRETFAARGIREPLREYAPAEAQTFYVGGRLAGAAVAAHDRLLLVTEDGTPGTYSLNDVRFDLATRTIRPSFRLLAGAGPGRAVAFDPWGLRAAVGDGGGGFKLVGLLRGSSSLDGTFGAGSAVEAVVAQPRSGRLYFSVASPGRLEVFASGRRVSTVLPAVRSEGGSTRIRAMAADLAANRLVMTVDDAGPFGTGHDRVEVRSTSGSSTPLYAEWSAAGLGIADVGQLAIDDRQGLGFVVDNAPEAPSRAVVIMDLKTGALVDRIELSRAAVTSMAYDGDLGLLIAAQAAPGGYTLIDVAARRATPIALSADATGAVIDTVTHTAGVVTRDGRLVLLSLVP